MAQQGQLARHGLAAEWGTVGAVDHAEGLRPEVERLRRENKRLRRELAVAQVRLREAAADRRSEAAEGLFDEPPGARGRFRRFVLFFVTVIVPWLLVGLSVYAVYGWAQ